MGAIKVKVSDRIEAVKLHLAGETAVSVAAKYGVSSQAVNQWKMKYISTIAATENDRISALERRVVFLEAAVIRLLKGE